MKGFFSCCSILLMVFCLSGAVSSASAARAVSIDILYMNHGPLQPTLKEMRELFSRYGSRIDVSWHDFESEDGAAFMKKKGISQHVPLKIWLDGKDTATLEGDEVKFVGFPTGAGPLPFQGRWTVSDLQKAIDQIVPKE